MLMMNHRGRQHFFGQLKKFLREASRNHHRILDQIRDLVEHALADQRARDAPAAAARFALELTTNAIAAFGTVEDHEVLGEPLAIVVEALDLHGAARPARGGQEAMSVG